MLHAQFYALKFGLPTTKSGQPHLIVINKRTTNLPRLKVNSRVLLVRDGNVDGTLGQGARAENRALHRPLVGRNSGDCRVRHLRGGGEFLEAVEWAEVKGAWLRRLLPLKNGIPSHDTVNRVFRLLDPKQCENAFRSLT
ncbi:transposase family protein [Chromobacterium violaceum]|uniref:transposase family protein n=1 Tax=Chromobacterium violaceum TaxID=536 RepID=UPI00143D10F7|nr:transposase family protein [Chromobacterium violaceum]QIY79930.1 transposase family protein [Chromobacterium violaceum]